MEIRGDQKGYGLEREIPISQKIHLGGLIGGSHPNLPFSHHENSNLSEINCFLSACEEEMSGLYLNRGKGLQNNARFTANSNPEEAQRNKVFSQHQRERKREVRKGRGRRREVGERERRRQRSMSVSGVFLDWFLPHYFLGKVSHWSWNPSVPLGRLAHEPESYPSLYRPHLSARLMIIHSCSWIAVSVLGIWTQVLLLT